MTKVSKDLVRCAKCGKHSEQLVVYSINFLQGDEEENNRLLEHKQKCPYCGYEARNIAFEDNIEDFYGKDYVEEEKPLLWEEWNNSNTIEEGLVFDAFIEKEDESSYYYIIKGKDNYIVKYREQKQGVASEDNYELITHTVSQEEYESFIMSLKFKVSKWNEKYEKITNSPYFNWYLNSQEFPKNYEGSNDAPDNFEEVASELNSFFQTDYQDTSSDEIFVTFKISNGKDMYTMMLNCYNRTGCISLLDDSNILLPRVFDKSSVISREEFDELINELDSISNDWLPIYKGSSNTIWKLDKRVNDEIVDVYNGKGATPDNWDTFLDFMAKCEKILSRKKEL